MRVSLAIAAALVAMLGVVGRVQALPVLDYCPRTGDLWVENDVNGAILNIKSPAGSLNAPLFPEGSPPTSAVVDLSYLPNFIALLNLPEGRYRLGEGTVAPGTPVSELGMDYIPAFGVPLIPTQVNIFCVPELSSLTLAALSIAGWTAVTQRIRKSGVAAT